MGFKVVEGFRLENGTPSEHHKYRVCFREVLSIFSSQSMALLSLQSEPELHVSNGFNRYVLSYKPVGICYCYYYELSCCTLP